MVILLLVVVAEQAGVRRTYPRLVPFLVAEVVEYS